MAYAWWHTHTQHKDLNGDAEGGREGKNESEEGRRKRASEQKKKPTFSYNLESLALSFFKEKANSST